MPNVSANSRLARLETLAARPAAEAFLTAFFEVRADVAECFACDGAPATWDDWAEMPDEAKREIAAWYSEWCRFPEHFPSREQAAAAMQELVTIYLSLPAEG